MIDKETLKKYKKSFKTYTSLPYILGITIFVLFLLVDIVFALREVFGAVAFFVILLFGVGIAALVTVISRIKISAIVLQVHYLSKICDKMGGEENENFIDEWEGKKFI